MKKYFTTLALLVTLFSQLSFAGFLATTSISPSTTTINHPVQVSFVIQNTGASAVTLSNVKITATSTQNPTSSRLAGAVSVFNIGPNAPVFSLPALSTTTVPVGQVIFFSPSTGVTGSGSGTYSIGGSVTTSDGSVTAISQAGVATINPVPLPLYERL